MEPFASFPQLLSEEARAALCAECEELFSAKAKGKDGGAYSEGQTFWVSADTAAPRSVVEAFALNVFDLHTRGMLCDRSRSGSEYWPLLIDGDSDVGAHFDKDYGAEDHGRHLYPFAGTVTYLSGSDASPTLFFVCREEELLKSVTEGFLSRVAPGKHVRFDGRLLHAASSELSRPRGEAKRQKRVTLLVNVWLDHRPSDAVIAPEKANRNWIPLSLPAPEVLPELSVNADGNGGGQEIEMRLDKRRVLRFVAPPIEAVWQGKSSSLRLRFGEGACVYEERKKKKKGGAKKDKKGKKKGGK